MLVIPQLFFHVCPHQWEYTCFCSDLWSHGPGRARGGSFGSIFGPHDCRWRGSRTLPGPCLPSSNDPALLWFTLPAEPVTDTGLKARPQSPRDESLPRHGTKHVVELVARGPGWVCRRCNGAVPASTYLAKRSWLNDV